MSANLPPLPEPYSASSAIKCATCGASYKPGYSLMPQGNGFPSLIRQTACQGCGGTSFTASIGYDSPSPAKYTAGQMRAYATKAVAAQAAEMEALRADAERGRFMIAWAERNGLIDAQFCQPPGAPSGDYYILRGVAIINGNDCAGFGKTPQEAVDAARAALKENP